MRTADALERYLEALLFIAERPLETAEIAELAEVPSIQVEAALGNVAQDLEDGERGLRLQRNGDAWQLVTAPDVGERLATYAAREEARRLTPAALEALAVIAYRQPCTRADVERVRGVDSDYVIRSLLHRRVIAEVGRRDTPGRPVLFGTTFTFLERFGLTSLDDLPPLTSEAAAVAALADAERHDPAGPAAVQPEAPAPDAG